MVVDDQMACIFVHSLHGVEFAGVYHDRQFDATTRQMPGIDEGKLVPVQGQKRLDVSINFPWLDGLRLRVEQRRA